MAWRAARLACAWALVPAAALGAAEVVTIDWGAQQRFALQRDLPAGQELTVCGNLAKGQGVDWGFRSSETVSFNIHHHVGKQVFYSARRHQTRGLKQRFVPEQATTYCWAWTAPANAPARVELTLRY